MHFSRCPHDSQGPTCVFWCTFSRTMPNYFPCLSAVSYSTYVPLFNSPTIRSFDFVFPRSTFVDHHANQPHWGANILRYRTVGVAYRLAATSIIVLGDTENLFHDIYRQKVSQYWVYHDTCFASGVIEYVSLVTYLQQTLLPATSMQNGVLLQ